MARGALKSDLTQRPAVRPTIKFSPKEEPQLKELADKYLKGRTALSGIKKFVDAVGKYSGTFKTGKGLETVRGLRQLISASFNSLPKDIQDYLSPKDSFISKLYRGASHKSNPGPDGTINASFTTDEKHAERFIALQKRGRQLGLFKTEDWTEDDFRVYGSKDILKFDHIIDVTKTIKLGYALGAVASIKGERKDENEFIVTNIRWNPETGNTLRQSNPKAYEQVKAERARWAKQNEDRATLKTRQAEWEKQNKRNKTTPVVDFLKDRLGQ